jgi:hypothetical protein
MKNFNYEKAYFVQALPAFRNFNPKQKETHNKLLPLVKDLTQQRDLNIPVSDEMKNILSGLTCQEIAGLSRASYFVGHWKPGFTKPVFENSVGESWKVANVCDQILRERLAPLPHNILIYEGKFRVTFSNPDCWLWDEFGLATEKNLKIFKTSYKLHQLSFGENMLYDSAKKLAEICGDLWGNVDEAPTNPDYENFLRLKKENDLLKLKKRHTDKLKAIEKDIENSKIELKAFNWFIKNGIKEEYIDNCIYYSHTGRFCFGWRNPLTEKEKSELQGLLCEFNFDYDFK